MDKISRYLAEHITGEVVNDSKVKEYYAHDASILQVRPTVVVYPRNTEDLRKLTRFSYRMMEKGVRLPITARGNGTDQTGAAIGEGIIAVLPAHMNQVLELDEREQKIRIQPGLNFKALQDVLSTHGLYLPVHPLSYAVSTIGGAMANNASGDRSLKYGKTRDWVDRLEVVLANGELIETSRLNRNELNKKKGLPGLEGEIYRQLDGLISDNSELIDKLANRPVESNIGYAIDKVKRNDGSFDLTPLFVGSQGTLGIVSQAILRADRIPATSTLLALALKNGADVQKVVDTIRPLDPSIFDFIDKTALDMVIKITGREPYKLLTDKPPAAIFLIEFNGNRKAVAKAERLLADLGSVVVAETADDKDRLWAIRHSVNAVTRANYHNKVAVPIIEDATVPVENIGALLAAAKDLASKKFVEVAIWGHVGAGSLTVMPFVDLARLEDRQNIITLMNRYYTDVLKLDGVISGSRAEGRLRTPFGERQSGDELKELFSKIKEIFDPMGILNPNVKLGTDVRELIARFRSEYSNHRLNDHQPRH
jgi:FAD/FMN-containing dehydrogenase